MQWQVLKDSEKQRKAVIEKQVNKLQKEERLRKKEQNEKLKEVQMSFEN